MILYLNINLAIAQRSVCIGPVELCFAMSEMKMFERIFSRINNNHMHTASSQAVAMVTIINVSFMINYIFTYRIKVWKLCVECTTIFEQL